MCVLVFLGSLSFLYDRLVIMILFPCVSVILVYSLSSVCFPSEIDDMFASACLLHSLIQLFRGEAIYLKDANLKVAARTQGRIIER